MPFGLRTIMQKCVNNLFNMISIVKILKIKIAQMSSADQGNVNEDEDEDSETENSEVLQVLIKYINLIW